MHDAFVVIVDVARPVANAQRGRHPDDDVLTIEIPKDPPQVRIIAPERTEELSGKVRLAWEADGSGKALSYLVR